LAAQKWEELKQLLADNFEASWLQSREIMNAEGSIKSIRLAKKVKRWVPNMHLTETMVSKKCMVKR
jgi:hypothetical protein